MNCISENCKYARIRKVDNGEHLRCCRFMLVPYCELGRNISYPFIDDGKKDMRCECFSKAERREDDKERSD